MWCLAHWNWKNSIIKILAEGSAFFWNPMISSYLVFWKHAKDCFQKRTMVAIMDSTYMDGLFFWLPTLLVTSISLISAVFLSVTRSFLVCQYVVVAHLFEKNYFVFYLPSEKIIVFLSMLLKLFDLFMRASDILTYCGFCYCHIGKY